MIRKREYRVVVEAVILALLSILIVHLFFERFTPTADWLWPAMGLTLLIMAGVSAYQAWRRRIILAGDIGLLQGATWNLVLLMENYGTKSSGRRAAGRAKVLERFAVEGAKEVAAGRPMPMGDTGALDLTTLGFELITRNEEDGSKHWRRVNGIRRGLYCYLALVELQSPGLAYRGMVEHMKTQRKLGDGVDNFPELRRLLGLPTEWPTDDLPEFCERMGITVERERAVLEAVAAGMAVAFKGLQYKPWPEAGEQEQVYVGREILAEMREYMR